MHTCVFVWSTHTHVETRRQFGCYPFGAVHFLLETESHWPGTLPRWSQVTQKATRNLPISAFYLSVAEITTHAAMSGFFQWVLGIKLRTQVLTLKKQAVC